LILGIGGSALIGYTDKGQIDVAKTISDRNAQASVDNPNAIMIPVQSTTQEPDGGLIGLGIGDAQQNQASTTTATASSTASSTQPVGQSPGAVIISLHVLQHTRHTDSLLFPSSY
jgi:hypothetical protein